jgi:hypothetical protein
LKKELILLMTLASATVLGGLYQSGAAPSIFSLDFGAARDIYLNSSGNVNLGEPGASSREDMFLARGCISLSATDRTDGPEMPALSGNGASSGAGGMGGMGAPRRAQGSTSSPGDYEADGLAIDASVTYGDREFIISVRDVMAADPLGMHTTWGGVGIDKPLAESGENLPPATAGNKSARLVAHGVGDIVCHGETLASGVPVRVVWVDSGLPEGANLALDIGDPKLCNVRGLPGGMKQMRILWQGADEPTGNPF